MLLFYVLATYQVMSGEVPTCGSVHSWRFYGAASLGDQAVSTMTPYSALSLTLSQPESSHVGMDSVVVPLRYSVAV